jgi:hypothetical protein
MSLAAEFNENGPRSDDSLRGPFFIWAHEDLNLGPRPYQGRALAN